MKTYYTNEVRFLLPSQCVDRSITAFMVPREGSPVPPPPGEPGEFSLILTREEVPSDLTLLVIVSDQLDALEAAVSDFMLNNHVPMRQQQTHFLHGGILVSVTGTAQEADFSRHRNVLDLVLTTMKLNN